MWKATQQDMLCRGFDALCKIDVLTDVIDVKYMTNIQNKHEHEYWHSTENRPCDLGHC